MQRTYSYLTMLLYCLFAFFYLPVSFSAIAALLLTIILLSFSLYFDRKLITGILFISYCILGFFFPEIYFFLPLLLGEVGRMGLYPTVLLCIFGIIIRYPPLDIFHLANHPTEKIDGIFPRMMDFTPQSLFLLTFGCILALFLDQMCRQINYLEQKNKETRDESAELNFVLQDRNRLLIEKQDYEIHTAMLQERTRIAREIHDNAGHMLSRCILLTGMIKTLNTDDKCNESLQLLDSELAKTMDSIRDSVHNLHKESLNLEEKITELLSDFSFCPVNLEYHLGKEIPSSIKYTFLAITKEALTNVAKHSNATAVQIRIIEHPSMYQLVISDNGTNIKTETDSESGIGLQNMKDRITALNGTLQILRENGFRIFISVPKKEKESEENYGYSHY